MTEQILSPRHDDLKRAYDASVDPTVDPTEARNSPAWHRPIASSAVVEIWRTDIEKSAPWHRTDRGPPSQSGDFVGLRRQTDGIPTPAAANRRS